MMPFEGIRKLFPNVNLQTVENEIRVHIPMKDVIETLKNNLREDLRPYTTIEPYPDGILMKIDVGNSILARVKAVSPNIRISPDVIEVFIPKEDIIKSFKVSNPNMNIEYSEKGVVVSAKLM